MAESEQLFRQAQIHLSNQSNQKLAHRGQWCAFSLGVIGILIGGGLIYFDKQISGSILSGSSLIGLVALFIQGYITKKSEKKSTE